MGFRVVAVDHSFWELRKFDRRPDNFFHVLVMASRVPAVQCLIGVQCVGYLDLENDFLLGAKVSRGRSGCELGRVVIGSALQRSAFDSDSHTGDLVLYGSGCGGLSGCFLRCQILLSSLLRLASNQCPNNGQCPKNGADEAHPSKGKSNGRSQHGRLAFGKETLGFAE